MSKDVTTAIDAAVDHEEIKRLMIELVEVPSPQTELMEDEPEVREFIKAAVEPRLRAFGIEDIR